MIVIGIIGTRRRDSLKDFKAVENKFIEIYEKYKDDEVWICSGGCPKGGDKFAKAIHIMHTLPYLEFPANWKLHGKKAGFIRNKDIAEYSDILIACVAEDRTGGTEDTINHFLKTFKKSKENLFLV